MPSFARSIFIPFLVLAGLQATPARSASDLDAEALDLESAPVDVPETVRGSKLFIEGAMGNASQRYLPHSVDTRRTSVDFSHTARLGQGLRAVISDRLDYIHPRQAGADEIVNSLREAYLGLQSEGGNTLLEFGRVNLRYGPGYGYNPTDFFRAGSLRVLTSADPFALRENRLGTVMLRAQRLWTDGSLSVALAPKLANRPNPDGWSLDLGSTNSQNRALIALGTQFSQRVSSQLLVYKEDGNSPALGANMTTLLSDAAVAHLEWSRSSEPDLLSRALALPSHTATRNRFVGGATYTTLGKLSITAEYQYNGFARNPSDGAIPGAAPVTQLAYLREALRLQELASRQAYLVYVTQKGLWSKDLDLTAYLRFNPGDNSRLAWLELRRHWRNLDLTFQLQQNMGRSDSEFGVLPDRRVMQIMGTYYF